MARKRIRSKPANVIAHVAAVNRGSVRGDFKPFGSPRPTMAMPGSAEKLAVLRARCAAGRELWSDGDRMCFDDREE